MTVATLPRKPQSDSELTDRCRQTAAQLVEGFAVQDIDKIMGLFADDSTYCDVGGDGPRGDEYVGKTEIRRAFLQGFVMLGEHTYEALSVVAEGTTAFASWVLILGRAGDPSALRFDGADHFEMNEEAQVVLKKAWVKGQSQLLAEAS